MARQFISYNGEQSRTMAGRSAFIAGSSSRRNLRSVFRSNVSGNCLTVTVRVLWVIWLIPLRVCMSCSRIFLMPWSTGIPQQARQLRLGIAHRICQHVLPVTEERDQVAVVPAALAHARRESAKETQVLQPGLGGESCGDEAVVSIKHRQGL